MPDGEIEERLSQVEVDLANIGQGAQGPPGPKGDAGDQGPKGDKGESAEPFSVPPVNCHKVTNIYVDNNGKLVIKYDDAVNP